MPAEVIMPALGMAQDTGTVLRWLKRDGDAVAEGEPLAEIETDKATVEIEAPASGTLASVRAAEGTEVTVGTVIANTWGPRAAREVRAWFFSGQEPDQRQRELAMRQPFAQTKIVFYDRAKQATAERVRRQLGVGALVFSRNPTDVVDVTVVVGKDFN